MGLFSRRNHLVETRTTRPTLMTRLKGPNAKSRTVKTTTKIEPESVVAARNGGRVHNTHHNNGYGHTHGHTHGHHHNHTHHYNTRRKNPSMGDKVEGALTKFRGEVTGRPGVKVSLL